MFGRVGKACAMAVQSAARYAVEVERRRSERSDLFYRTVLRIGERTAPADLVNLSRSGFMVRTNAVLDADSEVGVVLPIVGERRARVVWALGGRMGAEFRAAIEESVHSSLLDALPRGG